MRCARSGTSPLSLLVAAASVCLSATASAQSLSAPAPAAAEPSAATEPLPEQVAPSTAGNVEAEPSAAAPLEAGAAEATPPAPEPPPPEEPPPALEPSPAAEPPPPLEPPPPAFAEESLSNRRDSWYIGFAFGSGFAWTTLGTEARNWSEIFEDEEALRFSFDLEAGGTLAPQLLLGGRIASMSETYSEGDASVSLRHANYLLNLTYFPMLNGEGLFLRAGAGLATIEVTVSEGFSETSSTGEAGFGASAGLGYAFWLGESFNLLLSNDFNYGSFGGDEEYGEPTSGWFDAIQLGFYWY